MCKFISQLVKVNAPHVHRCLITAHSVRRPIGANKKVLVKDLNLNKKTLESGKGTLIMFIYLLYCDEYIIIFIVFPRDFQYIIYCYCSSTIIYCFGALRYNILLEKHYFYNIFA